MKRFYFGIVVKNQDKFNSNLYDALYYGSNDISAFIEKFQILLSHCGKPSLFNIMNYIKPFAQNSDILTKIIDEMVNHGVKEIVVDSWIIFNLDFTQEQITKMSSILSKFKDHNVDLKIDNPIEFDHRIISGYERVSSPDNTVIHPDITPDAIKEALFPYLTFSTEPIVCAELGGMCEAFHH